MWRVSDGTSQPYDLPPSTREAEGEFDVPRNSAPLATASVIVALVIPLLGVVFMAISASLLAARDFPMVGVVSVIEGILVFLLAVTAAILAMIVIVRRGPGRARAGAALGVAGLSVWTIVVQLINGALLDVFFS